MARVKLPVGHKVHVQLQQNAFSITSCPNLLLVSDVGSYGIEHVLCISLASPKEVCSIM